MIYSHRSENEIANPNQQKKQKKPSSLTTPNPNKLSSIQNENSHQVSTLISKIREHELKQFQYRNELLKKDIELKEKNQQLKDIQKEVISLKRDKQAFIKYKDKFDLQRKNKEERILELQNFNEELRNRLDSREVPKDRYETCMRELDELKNNIEVKEDVVKQRDLYKYFYEEVKDLITSPEYTAEEVRNSLKSFFTEMSDKLTNGTKQ